jgi:hypothetical protein
MMRATVSGSFHRHMSQIADAVSHLGALGVEVLSPADPRIVDADGEFLFVASDRLRSRRLVEDRHLEAIRHSDFLWVVCPDGYTGASTSGEILAAAVLGKPVFSTESALDITIGDYVERVGSMADAIARVASKNSTIRGVDHVLLHPEALDETASRIDDLRLRLSAQVGDRRSDAEYALSTVRQRVSRQFGFELLH